MMQLFPSTFSICMSSAMSLPFTDDPCCHFPSQKTGRYGPTVDLVPVEDVTHARPKGGLHTDNYEYSLYSTWRKLHTQGYSKIIISSYPLCRNYSDSEWGMSCFVCLIITGGEKEFSSCDMLHC